MAIREEITLIDDIDGSVAESTVSFAIDGADYEIDLSTTHRNLLIRDLARYMAAARQIGGETTQAPVMKPVFIDTKPDPHAVRIWARANGFDIPQGKRIPKEVIEAFKAAGN